MRLERFGSIDECIPFAVFFQFLQHDQLEVQATDEDKVGEYLRHYTMELDRARDVERPWLTKDEVRCVSNLIRYSSFCSLWSICTRARTASSRQRISPCTRT